MVYLISGKRGAGKSTYAKRLADEYIAKGQQAIIVDGDEVRELWPNDFTDEGRINNLTNIAKICALIEYQGAVAIAACVSPKKEWRQMMRTFWAESRLVYIPGGTLWEGTEYEWPDSEELMYQTRTYPVANLKEAKKSVSLDASTNIHIKSGSNVVS